MTVPSETENDPHKFVFELDLAIREQVLSKLKASPRLPLSRNAGPRAGGVYVLYWKKQLVYVGKASQATTSSKRTLRARLNEHVSKINGRQNINLEDMSCRFLTIESDWFVWAAEHSLITSLSPEWNRSGFGSKVPGVGRPGTDRISLWNQQFPPK